MKVKGITESELRQIVSDVSEFYYDGNLTFKREPETIGNFVHFTLRVNDSSGEGARRSGSGRRTVSACWHAHKRVMLDIFGENPDAILVSALARYEGQGDFLAKYEATGDTNVGSMAAPVAMRYSCDCDA